MIKVNKKYLKGKRSYENAMQCWSGEVPPFKTLSKKDRDWWSSDIKPQKPNFKIEVNNVVNSIRNTQRLVFDLCILNQNEKFLPEKVHEMLADLESSLDRAYDRLHESTRSLH
jgi:hypothetical protein